MKKKSRESLGVGQDESTCGGALEDDATGMKR